jgi:hypothetical protein
VPTDEDEEGIYSSTESRNTTGLIFYTLATALVVTKGGGGGQQLFFFCCHAGSYTINCVCLEAIKTHKHEQQQQQSSDPLKAIFLLTCQKLQALW